MSSSEVTLWGIHAGRTGQAHELFMSEGLIALGWNAMPDLSTIPADREAYKAEVRTAYPDMKDGAVPGSAGQLFRFVNEMAVGDLVAYPSKTDRQIHLGRIEGDYFHVPSPTHEYAQRRKVSWLKTVPRTQFSQGALYEIGSALSFFQIKNYADEFLAVIEGQDTPPGVEDDDPTVALVAEEIESTTRDFVVKQLAKELKGHPFERFVANLLEAMGYRTRVSPEGSDGGVDIVAYRDELGIEPPIIKVQVKSGEGSVGEPEVSQLFGKVADGEYGLFVTLGSFSAPAKRFATSKANLRLVGAEELVRLTLEYYDQLDAKYKGILPLRSVFIPEGIGVDVD